MLPRFTLVLFLLALAPQVDALAPPDKPDLLQVDHAPPVALRATIATATPACSSDTLPCVLEPAAASEKAIPQDTVLEVRAIPDRHRTHPGLTLRREQVTHRLAVSLSHQKERGSPDPRARSAPRNC